MKFIFENEAVIGINSPSDCLYMRIISFMLSLSGAWPYKEIGQQKSGNMTYVFKYFNLFMCLGGWVTVVAYIKVHFSTSTFLEIGHLYITLFISTVNLSRILTLTFVQRYRIFTRDFLTQIHLFFYKDKTEFTMKIHKQIHKTSHIFTLFVTAQMIICITFFNLVPLYNNYASGKFNVVGNLQNSTFEHSVYLSLPIINTSTNFNGYIIGALMNLYYSITCAVGFCMYDSLLAIMVFQFWGHFKILNYNLRNFPIPTMKSNVTLEDGSSLVSVMYSKDEQLQVFEKLRECINYHRLINKFIYRMSDVFGPMLFVYYMFHQISICLLLLECSQMTTAALVQFLPLTNVVLQQLIQISIVFELIGSESEKIKDSVYGVPWECMDVKNRKIVIVFLMNVQEPIHVKALGLANVGVTSMATILKTSMSYFTFLRSV